MANHGMPLNRHLVKIFARDIVKKRGGCKLPSDGWLGKFFKRHGLSLRVASQLDGGRVHMARESVIAGFFDLYSTLVKDTNVTADRIYNVDETGFGEGQYNSRVKSVVKKGIKHPYIKHSSTREHTSAVICASGSGVILPPMIIFKDSFPHSCYASEGVSGSLYAVSKSGHIDSSLYINFIEKLFIPNIPPQRPVILIQDNHASHLSLPLIELCRANDIILLNLPPHTTHILQPLDQLFDTLKSAFTNIARTASLLRENLIISKTKFTPVLKQALKSLTPKKVATAFRKTGIHPIDRHAIDKTKLISDMHHRPKEPLTQPTLYMECTSEPASPTLPSHIPNHPQGTQTDISSSTPTYQATQSVHHSSPTTSSKITQTSPIQGHCTACNTIITENPLVSSGIISPSLAKVLWVPTQSQKKNQRRKIKAMVITSDEAIELRKKTENEKLEKERCKLMKQEQRENLKIAIELEKEERKKERLEKKQKKQAAKQNDLVKIDCFDVSQCNDDGYDNDSLCNLCFCKEPPNFEDIVFDWITCEICDVWFHKFCVNLNVGENVYICGNCLSK